MKIILKHDIKKIGSAGDIKTVADGYARNYLLPKGLALEALPSNLRVWENEKKALEKKKVAQVQKEKEHAEKLETVSCTISVKTGEDKKMFGSVTVSNIAESIKEAGFDVDKKDVLLKEPIKELGAYDVEIRVSTNVHAKIKVWVVDQK